MSAGVIDGFVPTQPWALRLRASGKFDNQLFGRTSSGYDNFSPGDLFELPRRKIVKADTIYFYDLFGLF